jgi:hypothetical protein
MFQNNHVVLQRLILRFSFLKNKNASKIQQVSGRRQ